VSVSNKTCLLIAGSEISEDVFPELVRLAEQSELVICADRGYAFAEKAGVRPDILIGDFDSYTGTLPDDIEILRSVPEKDDTDTMLAVKTAISRGVFKIVMYGGLGGRFDHTMANVQTLVYAFEHGCSMQLADGENVLTVQGTGLVEYPCIDGWYFSVFSLTPETIVRRMAGVKYPLESYVLKSGFPLGVSNEITEGSAEIDIENGMLLIVYSKK